MANPFDTVLRKYATQATVALSLVVGITGVMLFYRIGKPQVGGMHEWLGMGFVVVAVLHVLRHRGGFVAMLAQPRMRVLLAAAALAAAAFVILTPPRQPNPMREINRLVTSAPLHQVAPLLEISAEQLAQRLNTADTSQSISAIAKAQGAEPMQVLMRAMGK
jgi:hypothetical protein